MLCNRSRRRVSADHLLDRASTTGSLSTFLPSRRRRTAHRSWSGPTRAPCEPSSLKLEQRIESIWFIHSFQTFDWSVPFFSASMTWKALSSKSSDADWNLSNQINTVFTLIGTAASAEDLKRRTWKKCYRFCCKMPQTGGTNFSRVTSGVVPSPSICETRCCNSDSDG